MLDLLISYVNFLILAISYIVNLLTYLPPNPPKYEIRKEKINCRGKIKEKEEIYFLDKDNDKNYKKIKPNSLNINFYQIITGNSHLPILILTPKYHYPICIIYCQGNNGDLGTSFYECYGISLRTNCIIVTFEYPGYGICKNVEKTESEFYRRIKTVYEYITKILSFKPNQIILYGFSMGTGIAFDFACKKEYPVSGLILQSPFLSIIRTIYNVKKTKYFDLFNNCDKAKYLCRKTLFLHGDHDKIVPYIHGRILSELIPEKYFYDFLTVHEADHNNLLKVSKDKVFDYINAFIAECMNASLVTDYNDENIVDTLINIDKNKDKRKISDLISLKSEDFRVNEGDENRKRQSSQQKEENYEKNNKAYSFINEEIINTIKEKENNHISKNNNQNEKIFIKPNYDNQNLNLRYNIVNKNSKINQNDKPKFLNNYYYVNIGTNSRNYNYNNNYPIYIKPSINLNDNINNLKNISIENSFALINSSTNNITNSTNN